MRRIAVVGASGFVGSTLVERLLAQGRDEVLPFIHSSGNAMRLARRGAELRMVDLLDAEQVERALAGVTHVVNCSRGGDEVMLTGLKNLLAACRKHRTERFVHLSSVAVYGDPPPEASVRENAPTAPERGSYGWIKLRQDRMVEQAAAAGVPAQVLCPPNISGPYSYFLIGLVEALRARRFVLLENGTAPCNLIDVSNLSHAIELALDNGPADGKRMFVTDDADTTWRDMVDALASLTESGEEPPGIGRAQLASAGGARAAPAISVVKSLKHLVSSEVREAMRKDPLWGKVDVAMRRGVARMGKATENNLRLAVEGPATVTKVAAGARFDIALSRQQLRGVRHSCELARSRLGYRPLVGVPESMAAFRKWYRFHHGMDTAAWPLLRHLY